MRAKFSNWSRMKSGRTLSALSIFRPVALCFLAIVLTADSSFAFDDSKLFTICGNTYEYLDGGFGALLAAIAGIGAIIASAAGGFRMAWALLVVSLGSYILKEYVGLFFTGGCG